MKRCLLFVIIYSSAVSLLAQDFSIGLQTGYNYYNMSDLQAFQKTIVDDIYSETSIPLKRLDNFPSFYNYQIQMFFLEHKNLNIGLFFDFASTGGRSHYADYSGELKIDQLIKQKSFGVIINKDFSENQKTFYPALTLKVFLISSLLEYSEYLSIGESSTTQKFDFNSSSIGIEPSISFMTNLNRFLIGLGIGYKLTIPSEFTLENNANATLENDENPVHAQWNGFNIHIIIGYCHK